MAELYLRQGHRDEAVAIYRDLVARRPEDDELQRRYRELASEGGVGMFRDVLERLVQAVPEAMAAALMGFDGIAVESFARAEGVDLQTFLAEYSVATQQLRQVPESLPDAGTLVALTIERQQATCVIAGLTDDYFLALMLRPPAIIGRARYHMRLAAPALAKELG